MRKQQTLQEHIDELRYLRSVNPQYPGSSFNFQSSVFAEYCDMQARFAQSDGYSDIAESMRDCRDIALHHVAIA